MEGLRIEKQCSTGAIIVHNKKVLLLKRVKKGKWSTWELPGGKCSRTDGDTITCLIRETQEETNLEVKPDQYLGTIVYKVGKQDHPQHNYLCSPTSNISRMQINPEEHSEFRWVKKSEVEDLVEDEKLSKEILKAI